MKVQYICDLDFTGKEALYSVRDQEGAHVATFDDYGEAEQLIEALNGLDNYRIYSWGVMGSYE